MGRAIGVFKKSGGIFNTKRAVKLGVHLRELHDPARAKRIVYCV
jgi:hypothetical protein